MFENILGHSIVKKTLQDSINNNAISHAYIFYGKEGVGKKLTAIEFAKKLLETDNLQNNVDFKVITKAPDKQNILVEQIREDVIEDVYIAPAMSKYKVYIIDDADKMNIAAQNTLLKTLEEPPSSVVIILITNNIDGLIGTILSRTNNIFFEKLSDDEMKEYMRKNNISVDSNILEFADGSISTLLNMSSEENTTKLESVEVAIKALENKSILKFMDAIKELDFKDNLIIQYIEFLLLKNNLYDKIELIEETKKALIVNANEDMQKTKLAINILSKG